MALLKQSDTTHILRVTTIGNYIRDKFDGSLHRFSDDGQRLGVIYPHGLWYVGPVNPKDAVSDRDRYLEVVFDRTQLTLADVQAFLARYGIETNSDSTN